MIQSAKEREERAQLRCEHLRYLPLEVAAWAEPFSFEEGYAHTPPAIKWAYATEVAIMADRILEQVDIPIARLPITFVKYWATQLLRIR